MLQVVFVKESRLDFSPLLGQTSIAIILAVMSCRKLIQPILRVFCQVPEYLPRYSVGSAESGRSVR